MSSSFDKTLETLDPHDARKWQEFKNGDWKEIQEAVLRLFQLRKYPDLANDLHHLNEKLHKLSRSEVGQFIGDFYQDQILKRGMIILRHEVKEEEGVELLKKLASIWTQFYTSILPTLQAIFFPVQLENLSIRSLSLLTFRDVVLLKTKIKVALKSTDENEIPEQIRQMLLVLQGVHRTPPSEDYFTLTSLLLHVVQPYQCLVPRNRSLNDAGTELWRSSRADTVAGMESPTLPRSGSSMKRRHSFSAAVEGDVETMPDNKTPTPPM